MSKSWLETGSDDEAGRQAVKFWQRLGSELDSGEFWAHRIKKLRDQPEKRLALALDHLPLPGAFREAAIAIRAVIRQKRKTGEPPSESLSLLYWLGAIHSFAFDRTSAASGATYSVLESVPGKKLRSLAYTYEELGYEKLSLLNKTDVKWITEAWGEPKAHTTLNAIHRDVWKKYEARQAERSRSRFELQRHSSEGPQARSVRSDPERNTDTSGCSAGLFLGVTYGVLRLLWWLWF